MKITVLTATYNRAHTLPVLYKSLTAQSCKLFEWIIVDDGSNDDTEQLVMGWVMQETDFSITYIPMKNGGKHRAVNRGVAACNGDYVFIVDSDDYLTEDAIEKVYGWVDTIDSKDGFAGVAGLKAYTNGQIIGGQSKYFKKHSYIDAANTERLKYKLQGDKAEIYKASLLKKYPFPTFENENFISEDVVWNQIAKDGYQLRWFNDIIYIAEYLEDGLTHCTLKQVNNFNGYTCSSKLKIYLSSFPYQLFYIGQYVSVAEKKGFRYSEIKNLINQSEIKVVIGSYIFRFYCRIRKKKDY